MIKVIYHANCSDGFCAAFLFWQKYGDKAEYIPFHYGVPLELDKFNKGDIVYIVDFSFNQPTLLELAENVASVTVLDHHKTAKEDLDHDNWPVNVSVEFDMNRSGARMAWDYLHSEEEPPKIVQYVQDRDLWKFELPQSKAVNAYLQALPFEFEEWEQLFKIEDKWLISDGSVVQMGKAILMKLKQQIDLAVKHGVRCKLGKYKPYAVNSTVNFSEVAGELAKKGDFGVAWFVRSDGKYQYSLRSEGTFDVSKIAKEFGGGGHRNAAGFESDTLLIKPAIDPTKLLGKVIKAPNKISETGYVYIYGYDPIGVNPLAHIKGCSVPHFMVFECTEGGSRVNESNFNIPENEMEGILECPTAE